MLPLGYVFGLTVLAVMVSLALVRIRRWGQHLFVIALPPGELPQLWIALLLVSTAAGLADGSLAGPAGPVLLAAAALILAGLLELWRRALSARSVVDVLLASHGLTADRRPWWWARPLLFPVARRPSQVVRVGPIPYGSHRRQRLDVCHPRGPRRTGAVLAYLHGGGYFSGSNRREGIALLHRLAARGWVCISATYRLRPQFGFDDHMADARAVLRWAHEHATDFGGEANKVAMAGSSAGGHMTALLALDPEWTTDPGLRVDAGICLNAYLGRYYDRGADEPTPSHPLSLDASSAPPMFISHGTHDSYVPVEMARAFRDHLAAGSRAPRWYLELPGAQHSFDRFQSWRFTMVIDAIEAFLSRELQA